MLLSWAENPPNPPIQAIHNNRTLIYRYPRSLDSLKFPGTYCQIPKISNFGDNSLENFREKG